MIWIPHRLRAPRSPHGNQLTVAPSVTLCFATNLRHYPETALCGGSPASHGTAPCARTEYHTASDKDVDQNMRAIFGETSGYLMNISGSCDGNGISLSFSAFARNALFRSASENTPIGR